MSEAVRRLVRDAKAAVGILRRKGHGIACGSLMMSIEAVELELDPPFTVHKVVKTVAADDRPQQDEQTIGFR
jgi:hypothetical protein